MIKFSKNILTKNNVLERKNGIKSSVKIYLVTKKEMTALIVVNMIVSIIKNFF